jgi:hypothetical protein
MNKRQRKKHRIAEFQELGFALRFCTPASWSRGEQDAFWNECIRRVEDLGLALGGGTGECWDVFVTTLRERGSVTVEQRQALLEWLGAQPGISAIQAGGLEDAWYDDAPPCGAAA